MADKGIGVGECGKHGVYFLDACDSPCPSCEDEIAMEAKVSPDAVSIQDSRRILYSSFPTSSKVINEVCSIEPIVYVRTGGQVIDSWDEITSCNGDVFESDEEMGLACNISHAIKWAIDVKAEAGYSKEEVKKFVETELAIRKDEIRITRVNVNDDTIQDYIESVFEEEEEEPTSRYINLEIPDSDLKVQVKLDDEGVVVDVYRDYPDADFEGEMDVTASTYKFYKEFGVKLITE